MNPLIIYPKNKEQEKLYIQLAKMLDTRVEKLALNSSIYNKAFVKKIKQGKKEKELGLYQSIHLKDLWN